MKLPEFLKISLPKASLSDKILLVGVASSAYGIMLEFGCPWAFMFVGACAIAIAVTAKLTGNE